MSVTNEITQRNATIASLERQLAEAQAHVRNHHLEPCVSCAATESERDALNAEVERLAECRCTDHWDAPAVDGCAVCVRERLATAALALSAAVAEERESCAKLTERLGRPGEPIRVETAKQIAAAIRAQRWERPTE